MGSMIITRQALDEANYRVTLELRALGLYTPDVAGVDTRLVPFSWDSYGLKYRGRDGEIHIPAISVCRLGEIFGTKKIGLRDVLRHEFAHALVDLYPEVFWTREFIRAFGAEVDSEVRSRFDSSLHVSRYAATKPEEDFAEVFMIFVRTGGRYRSGSPAIRRKFEFVAGLSRRLRKCSLKMSEPNFSAEMAAR